MKASHFAQVREWMFSVALPKWSVIGFDSRHGGAIEAVRSDGACPSDEHFMRTRVTARQVYVFSHAGFLGHSGADPLAARAMEFLAARRLANGAWPRRMSPEGDVIDPTPDLYDIAFVLFALGWRVRASRDPTARRLAEETLAFIQDQMRHPSGQGFLHALPPTGPRLQNPHMHLLEAALVCFEATHDERWANLGMELISLFETRFFDPITGTLGEYFCEDLRRTQDHLGRHVEPGHMFEWAWILAQAQRLLGTDRTDLIQRLVLTAEALGVDTQTGLVFNVVQDDGVVIDRSSRTWPNTERIKGWLALFEVTRQDPSAAVGQSTDVLLERYLSAPASGLWQDRIDADGQLVAAPVPASTFYHLFLAFAELLRLEAKLVRAA